MSADSTPPPETAGPTDEREAIARVLFAAKYPSLASLPGCFDKWTPSVEEYLMADALRAAGYLRSPAPCQRCAELVAMVAEDASKSHEEVKTELRAAGITEERIQEAVARLRSPERARAVTVEEVKAEVWRILAHAFARPPSDGLVSDLARALMALFSEGKR